MESRIKIKVGALEVEYEGSEEFIKKEFTELLITVSTLLQNKSTSEKYENNKVQTSPSDNNTDDKCFGTTNAIAAKLDVKSGPELIMAAAAHLTFVKGHKSLQRRDLLSEIKSATSYFDKNMSKNYSNNLESLIKNKRLVEHDKDVFAVPAKERQRLLSILKSE